MTRIKKNYSYFYIPSRFTYLMGRKWGRLRESRDCFVSPKRSLLFFRSPRFGNCLFSVTRSPFYTYLNKLFLNNSWMLIGLRHNSRPTYRHLFQGRATMTQCGFELEESKTEGLGPLYRSKRGGSRLFSTRTSPDRHTVKSRGWVDWNHTVRLTVQEQKTSSYDFCVVPQNPSVLVVGPT